MIPRSRLTLGIVWTVTTLFTGRVSGQASECPTGDGTGNLDIRIGRAAEQPRVTLVGPDGSRRTVTGDTTLVGISTGLYRATIEPDRVSERGPIVGRAYSGFVARNPSCVRADTITSMRAGWGLEPGSGMLWTADDQGSQAVAIGAALLEGTADTGSLAVALQGALTAPKGIAFDAHGHLWVADFAGSVVSYRRHTLGDSDGAPPGIVIGGDAVAGAWGLAFDRDGGLWVSSPDRGRVVRLPGDALGSSGAKTPDVVLGGLDAPRGLAFDAEGNLWISNSGRANTVVRFDRDRLGTSTDEPPDVAIEGRSPPPVVSTLSGPRGLAFDRAGNLWVAYFGPNVIARYTRADQASGGALEPAIQITVDAGGILDGLAFDEAGNLWLPYTQGRLAMFSARDLTDDGSQAPSRIIGVTGLRYANGIAFNPSPSGLPLPNR